jgi:hypothetical protein
MVPKSVSISTIVEFSTAGAGSGVICVVGTEGAGALEHHWRMSAHIASILTVNSFFMV